MSIISGLTTSFKTELLQGIHDFTTTTGDVFYIALYSSTASIGPSTTAYTTTGEVSGDGYTAGGALLTSTTPTSSGYTAWVDFADVSWASATFSARGALIYNSTESKKSVMVLDFGMDRVATASTFTITFPTADAVNAIIRL